MLIVCVDLVHLLVIELTISYLITQNYIYVTTTNSETTFCIPPSVLLTWILLLVVICSPLTYSVKTNKKNRKFLLKISFSYLVYNFFIININKA